MTLEEYLAKFCGPHCYGEQDENGVDLSLIRSNLSRTPEERLLRGDAGRRNALELLEIGRLTREQKSAATDR